MEDGVLVEYTSHGIRIKQKAGTFQVQEVSYTYPPGALYGVKNWKTICCASSIGDAIDLLDWAITEPSKIKKKQKGIEELLIEGWEKAVDKYVFQVERQNKAR